MKRRSVLALGAAGILLPRAALAAEAREITWDDLIPSGVPYGEIVGMGEFNAVSDTWKPEYDDNATMLNTSLDGADVKLPGYIVPLETGSEGVSSFILVPYVGACIHVPPPPPNQLVFVTTATPWPGDNLWEAVWVTGRMSAKMRSTEIAEIGYEIAADRVEAYDR